MVSQLAAYRGALRSRDPDVDLWGARGPVRRSVIAFWIYCAAVIVYAGTSVYLTLSLTEDAAAFMAYAQRTEIIAEDIINFAMLVISVIGFFCCLGAARTAAHYFGIADFRWGWGWTIGSCFVPVIFLLRPWFGIAEIHGALVQTHRQDLQGTQWRDSGVALPTALFAGLTFVANLASYFIHDWLLPSQIDALQTTALETSTFLSSVSTWLYVDLMLTLSWVGYSIYYLWSIVEAEQELLKRD